MSLLSRYSTGNVDTLKSVALLKETCEISSDVILMVDEMYLQKSVQYHGGKYHGADEAGNLYKGIVVMMIQGLKKSIPIVVKALPEIEIKGSWLADELSECILALSSSGFNVRAVVSDNHSTNVKAFEMLKEKYPGQDDLFMNHPSCSGKTYLFFDNVHLLKNIRNSLLRAKKYSPPPSPFVFRIKDLVVSSPEGFILFLRCNSGEYCCVNMPQ